MVKIPIYTMFIYPQCVSDYNVAYKYLSNITNTYMLNYLNFQLFSYPGTYEHMRYFIYRIQKNRRVFTY